MRKSLGIPVIPSDWFRKDCRGNICFWSAYKDGEKGVPRHKEKEVHRFVRDIDKEIDRYEFIMSDSVTYLLELSYRYLASHENSWTVYLIMEINAKDDYIVDSKDLSLRQGDSILTRWKLSRW